MDPRYIYRPMLDLLGKSEGTDKGDGYNETLAYGAYTGGDVNLVGMTLDQVDALQTAMLKHPDNSWNSSAIGRYQIVRTTLRRIRSTLDLSGSELFDEAMQDRMGCFLLGLRGIDQWLDGKITEPTLINNLAMEWASLPTTEGVGYYGGQKSSVTLERVRLALAQVRTRHNMEQTAPEVETPPVVAPLPEMATIEAVMRLSEMDPARLDAASKAIALARAIQDGWTVTETQLQQTFTTEKTDMNGIKKWFQSKGVMGGLTAVAALLGPIFGLDLGQTNINDAQVAINELIAAIGAIVAIYGRVTAKSQVK